MMTCRDVATLIATGQVDGASLAIRLQVRLHVLMCRYCRAFLRQTAFWRRAGGSLRLDFEAEQPAGVDVERRVAHQLGLIEDEPPGDC